MESLGRSAIELAGEGTTILISDQEPVKPIYEAGIGRGFTRTNADQKKKQFQIKQENNKRNRKPNPKLFI
jgi:hypothetical protein